MIILGIIPARGGSKGVLRKNIRPLEGKPLISYTIESAKESKKLTRTIVSTDDEVIADVARKFGGQVPFLRPAELANDQAGMVPVLQHAVKWLEDNENFHPDIIVLLQPTTPFRRGMHIDSAIEKLIETKADSVLTIRQPDYSPYFMKTLVGDRTYPLLGEGKKYVRRQDAPVVYQPNGMVYVTRYNVLMHQNCILGEDTRGIVMSYEDSVNIDSIWDFKMAELILREKKKDK